MVLSMVILIILLLNLLVVVLLNLLNLKFVLVLWLYQKKYTLMQYLRFTIGFLLCFTSKSSILLRFFRWTIYFSIYFWLSASYSPPNWLTFQFDRLVCQLFFSLFNYTSIIIMIIKKGVLTFRYGAHFDFPRCVTMDLLQNWPDRCWRWHCFSHARYSTWVLIRYFIGAQCRRRFTRAPKQMEIGTS